jgi:hypothetical protein
MAEDCAKSVRGSAAPITWWKSSYSAYNGSCVEIAQLGQQIAVRDSKTGPGSPVLRFSHADWAAFLATLKRVAARPECPASKLVP